MSKLYFPEERQQNAVYSKIHKIKHVPIVKTVFLRAPGKSHCEQTSNLSQTQRKR